MLSSQVSRLMDLIVNSLYSSKEGPGISYTPVVRRGSALQLTRYTPTLRSLTDGKSADGLEIKIKSDEESKTIIIEDNGIGMTKDDLVEILGTIASSGTSKFMSMLKEKGQDDGSNLIGQFGVGFYSAFLVADTVTVVTKNDKDDTTWVWEASQGGDGFSIKPSEGKSSLPPSASIAHTTFDLCRLHRHERANQSPKALANHLVLTIPGPEFTSPWPRVHESLCLPRPLAACAETMARGTRIILKLKEEAEEFGDNAKLSSLVKTYSEFVNFPIKVWNKRQDPEQVVDEEATAKAKEEAKKAAEEAGKEPEEVKDVTKTIFNTVSLSNLPYPLRTPSGPPLDPLWTPLDPSRPPWTPTNAHNGRPPLDHHVLYNTP
eukprot:1194995-Prorocentrum_minimum.AAC.4